MEKTSLFAQFKTGFQSSFWIANGMELFERLAYYGQATILSVFLRDHLRFDEVEAGQLSSIFGGLIYFLPIFAGALADKFGFKKAFSFAFFILAIGYFLIGSTGISGFEKYYSDTNLFLILSFILIFTAIGGSFIKPSVLGTVALTTTKETKSLGYAIYYWLVNMGAAIGPFLAYLVRDSFGIQFVYLVSAISCALMFVVTLIFFKEPQAKLEEQRDSFLKVIINLLTVFGNIRFIIFLLIFALYWIVFWEFFIVIPFYIADYISLEAPIELVLSVGAWTIILLQIPINRLTKNIPTPTAIMIGFVFAALSWFLLYFSFLAGISVGLGLIVGTIFIFSVGEQTQAPRFYEYLADQAPKGQAALFQGFAFLPIAIAWMLGGIFGGLIYHEYGRTEMSQPEIVFLIIGLVGVIAAILMFIYNKSQTLFTAFEERRDSKFKELPADLGFNWGAFFVTPIWLLFHKKVGILLLIITLYIILYILNIKILTGLFAFVIFIISCYYGSHGNKIAWLAKKYSSLSEMQEKQKGWNVAGIIVFALNLLWVILLLIL